MSSIKIIIISILSVTISVTLSYFVFSGHNNKIAFVELNKIYLEFKMKKELELKVKSIQQTRNNMLDSLKIELEILSRQIRSAESAANEKVALYTVKRDKYFEKEKQFEQDNLAMAKMFDEQIFTQMNQYVKDYGLKNGYLVILGAEGSGSLMYAKEAINITEQVKNYINERYSGK